MRTGGEAVAHRARQVNEVDARDAVEPVLPDAEPEQNDAAPSPSGGPARPGDPPSPRRRVRCRPAPGRRGRRRARRKRTIPRPAAPRPARSHPSTARRPPARRSSAAARPVHHLSALRPTWRSRSAWCGGVTTDEKDRHDDQDDDGEEDPDLLAAQPAARHHAELGADDRTGEQRHREQDVDGVVGDRLLQASRWRQVSTIWKRSVPTATRVGIPMM